MSEVITISCDVCGSSIDHRDYGHREKRTMQMLRNFDSCDGKTFYKHLATSQIHICKVCYNKVLDTGKYLIDERVQGYGSIVIRSS